MIHVNDRERKRNFSSLPSSTLNRVWRIFHLCSVIILKTYAYGYYHKMLRDRIFSNKMLDERKLSWNHLEGQTVTKGLSEIIFQRMLAVNRPLSWFPVISRRQYLVSKNDEFSDFHFESCKNEPEQERGEKTQQRPCSWAWLEIRDLLLFVAF